MEQHRWGEKIFQIVNEFLAAAVIRMQNGTIFDARIIQASTSRKSQQGQPEPELGVTKKGNPWYYGIKVHVGVESQTKLIPSMQIPPANVHDSGVFGQLLHSQEEEMHGDKAYVGQEATIQQKAPKARSCILQRGVAGDILSRPSKRSGIGGKTPFGQRWTMFSARFSRLRRKATCLACVVA